LWKKIFDLVFFPDVSKKSEKNCECGIWHEKMNLRSGAGRVMFLKTLIKERKKGVVLTGYNCIFLKILNLKYFFQVSKMGGSFRLCPKM
jgi:hypothetical protein